MNMLASGRAPGVRPGIGRGVDREPQPPPPRARLPYLGGRLRRGPWPVPGLAARSRSGRAQRPRPGPRPRRRAAAVCLPAGRQKASSPVCPAANASYCAPCLARGGTAAPATAEPATSPHDQRIRPRPPARNTHPPALSGTHTAEHGTPAAPGTAPPRLRPAPHLAAAPTSPARSAARTPPAPSAPRDRLQPSAQS
jgi:hypothetical protein